MAIEIKHINGTVLYTAVTAADVKSALQEAVRSGADLSGADLSGADLSGAYLSGAHLSGAYLSGAYLSGADLSGADLSRADLSRAYLSRADLYGADLSGAYPSGADLSGADLSGAYLSRAHLSRANLSGAYLSGAYLSGADLYGADLSGAYLSGAYLSGADLSRAKNADYAVAQTRILPEGAIIGWKKAREGRIVKLRIPEDAKRGHAWGRKCRAERAEVLAVFDLNGNSADTASSQHDPQFTYRVGDVVTPTTPFDEDPWNECAAGIHFYISRIEAENHV